MNSSKEPTAFIIYSDQGESDTKIPLSPPSISIGKSSDNDVYFANDRTVSRRHCVIHFVGEEMVLEDLNSTNGTYLNGKRIEGREPLPNESQITVGRRRLFVIPNKPGYDTDSLIDSSYARADSILIPATGLFEKRTEAFLVVDVVRSTELLRKQDDLFLIKLVATLGKILERALADEERSFMKCTGDGFFSRFDTADSALNAAKALDRGVTRHFPELVKIAVALHWGSALYREEEGLIGKDVHAVFGLENVRRQAPEIGAVLKEPGARSLTLMTETFWNHLREDFQQQSKRIGSYPLKGLDEPEEIYRWVGR